MNLAPHLFTLVALSSAVTVTPAFAELVELNGGSEIVGISGAAPAPFYVEAERATHLGITALFETEDAPLMQSEESATYGAVSAVGSIDGVIVMLTEATLTIGRSDEWSDYHYLFRGVTPEGWVFSFYGYSPDPRFVPSLNLPTAAIPQGDWYEKWDIGVNEPSWAWDCYSDGAGYSYGAVTDPAVDSQAPQIRRQPASARVRAGQPAKFKVKVARSEGLQYQWFKDSLPLTGQVGRKLKLKATTQADTGWYEVVVSNAYGSVTSEAAQLVVR